MQRIPLSQGKYALVDDQDFDWLSQWNWFYHKGGYAVRNEKRSRVYMHRVIAKTPVGMLTDHTNGDKLDNQRANLRACTYRQNGYNRRANSGINRGTSIFKGVHLVTRNKKWCAQIQVNKQLIPLGHFTNEIDAARAYDTAAKKYCGEFACLNLPKPPLS